MAYRNIFGEERIQVPLFETGNATLDAILNDWFFGGGISGAGNIASAFAAGLAVISLTLSPVSITGAEAVGQPTVSVGVNLTNAGNIAGAEAFGQPGLSYSVSGAGNIVTAGAYGSPSVSQTVTANGIVVEAAYGQPALSLTITPTGIVTGAGFGDGSVSQEISLSGISGAEAFGTAAVEEIVPTNLYPVSIVGGEAFGTATITREYLIQGTVRDKTGATVSGADVNLFDAYTHVLIQNGVSDSNGKYRAVVADDYTNHFLVAFFGSNPRKVAVTVDTLKGK
jgi:hypothetical protein